MKQEIYQFKGQYIPPRMMDLIEQWVKHAAEPGSFLTAIIQNDLKQAVANADEENVHNLAAYVSYFYNEVPIACWGSPKAMEQWKGTHS